MIVVIQCAATKKPEAGYLRRPDGQKVLFVADPTNAPIDSPHAYAHPDDSAAPGKSWRQELHHYNATPNNNPLGLVPAWQLYKNETYALLADHFGLDRLYILSAGWGLIAAQYRTPQYDITFSTQADRYKQRRKRDKYGDLRMLPEDIDDPIVFFVSSGYVRLACELSDRVKGCRYLFYNSSAMPDAPKHSSPARLASSAISDPRFKPRAASER